jgi:Icc protein
MQQRGSVQIVQFTDTHFFGTPEGRLLGVDTAQSFQSVLDASLKETGVPDFYLLTGDLSQDESPQSYMRLAQLLAQLDAPAYSLPGNHDMHAVMDDCFANSADNLKADRHLIAGNWQVIMLDSVVQGEVGGHLDQDELNRLDHLLMQHRDKYALVALHHHPVPIGCHWIDSIMLDNGEDFFGILQRYETVRCVLWGHIHQAFDTTRRGIRLLATPSTCVQFKPQAPQFAVDEKAPGYRHLRLFSDGTIETAVIRAAQLPQGLQLKSAGY